MANSFHINGVNTIVYLYVEHCSDVHLIIMEIFNGGGGGISTAYLVVSLHRIRFCAAIGSQRPLAINMQNTALEMRALSASSKIFLNWF